MNKENYVPVTCQEQPSLRMRTLSKEQSEEMIRNVADEIGKTFFAEGSQASLVQDGYKTDCLFMLPSGNTVRIMVKINEEETV